MSDGSYSSSKRPCLVGKYFHTFNDDAVVYQGHVDGQVNESLYLVQLYSFVHGGATTMVLADIQTMRNWTFYANVEDWRHGLEEGDASRGHNSAEAFAPESVDAAYKRGVRAGYVQKLREAWVSVDEDLPPQKEEEYFVQYHSGIVAIADWLPPFDSYECFGDMQRTPGDEVCYWQPLPPDAVKKGDL